MTTAGPELEMISVPRAQFEAMKAEMKAELRRLRRAAGREVARSLINADRGPGDDVPVFTRDQLAEAWGIGD